MKITFNNINQENFKMVTSTTMNDVVVKNGESTGYRVDKSKEIFENLTYYPQENAEFNDFPTGDKNTIQNKRNQMAIMSGTMSDEEFGKMLKDGTSCMDMDIEEVVTIIDKIKAEMIKAGKHVQGYTDDLDISTLTQITGSTVLAQNLSDAYKECQIPITSENIAEGIKALNQANELIPLTDVTQKFMVNNELEPTIENLYKAQFSTTQESNIARKNIEYTAELNQQIEDIIYSAGYEVSENSLIDAKWLLDNNLPLTESSFTQYQQLNEMKLPLSTEDVCHGIASAIASGKPALAANLYDTSNIFEQVVDMEENIFNELAKDLTSTRIAEEIRLMMTTEANLKLLNSGYYIDTSDLEHFVDLLREQEKRIAEKMFDKENALPEFELFTKVNVERTTLSNISNALVGKLNIKIHNITMHQLYEEAEADIKQYENANLQYERCMTRPRSDLGDSIKTAFKNIDDILGEMNLPILEENQKAVRALGYNQMDITIDNIEAIKEASRIVEKTVTKMTPPTVIQMIKDGINPLEHTFDELNEYLDKLEPSYQEESEKYSKYLYQLEQNQEITAEEKEAYIGIYRLLRQIEKSDQGALGQVLNQGVDAEFSTLLTAIRSNKAKGIDILVSKEFGGLEELVVKGTSITDQIKAGFKGEFTAKLAEFDLEQERTFSKDMLKEIKELAVVDNEAIEICDKFSIESTPNNLLAIQNMVVEKNTIFNRLQEFAQKSKKDLAKKVENFHENFNTKDDAIAAYTDLVEIAQEIIEEVTFTHIENTDDINMMKMTHKQLAIVSKMSISEEYQIPVYIGEQLTSIHLVLQHKDEENGSVEVQLLTKDSEEIRAQIKVSESNIGCTIYFENSADDNAQKLGQLFYQALENNGISAEKPVYNNGFKHIDTATAANDIETRDLYRLAKIFIHTVNTL